MEEEKALTIKVQGNSKLVQRTIQRLKDSLEIVYVSQLIPNKRDEGYHAFLTVLEEEDFEV